MKHTIKKFQKKEMGGKLSQKLIIVWFLIAFFVIGNVGQVMAVSENAYGWIYVSGWQGNATSDQHDDRPCVLINCTSDATSITTSGLMIYKGRGQSIITDPVKIILNGVAHTSYSKETDSYGFNTYIFNSFTWNNLTPGSEYYMSVFYKDIYDKTRNIHYGPATDAAGGFFKLYTDITKPLKPYFENIKDKSLTVKWDIINGNRTNYIIYRSASPSGPWDNLGTVSNNYFNDTGSGLVAEQTYYYRVVANHTGVSQQITSDISEVITTADPAVAAAQEAASKAEAAREAAVLSQTASQNAESKATEAVELIKNLKTNFTDLEASFSPTIISVKGRNNATATTGNAFSVDVTASNATYFRAGVNGNYTAWQSSPRIDNISLPNSGINAIEVQAKRSNVEDVPVASGYITVFKIN